MQNGREGNAVNAVKVKAVLAGKWIERSEIGTPGEFDAMSDDELEHLLIERLGALGLSVVALPDSETQH